MFVVFVPSQADFPTVIGVTLDREDGSTPMETDGDKGKQSGTTYYIDTNQLRVPRENMEVMSPLKNGMSKRLVQVIGEYDFFHLYIKDWPWSFHMYVVKKDLNKWEEELLENTEQVLISDANVNVYNLACLIQIHN